MFGDAKVFARIRPNVPEKKLRPPKKLFMFFWALFVRRRVCSNVQRFCPDFRRFFPDFQKIKTFGGALAPSAPPPPTPVVRHKI